MGSLKLLSSPDGVLIGHLPPLDPISVKHSFPSCRQPCDSVDESLVEVSVVDTIDAYSELGVLPSRELIVRSGIIPKLEVAQGHLPEGFGLVVLDAWRSESEQEALIRYYGNEAVESGFVAPTSSDKMRPPHTTGGAVDLTLSWSGQTLALGTDYDAFESEAAVDFYEGTSNTRLKTLRRILANAMLGAGFAPYWSEWWHWSYGDDMWGWTKGKNALYEVVASK